MPYFKLPNIEKYKRFRENETPKEIYKGLKGKLLFFNDRDLKNMIDRGMKRKDILKEDRRARRDSDNGLENL